MKINSEKYLKTGVFTTAYYESGTGDETIILIHGGGAGADSYGNWRASFDLFATSANVIAMDMVQLLSMTKHGTLNVTTN